MENGDHFCRMSPCLGATHKQLLALWAPVLAERTAISKIVSDPGGTV